MPLSLTPCTISVNSLPGHQETPTHQSHPNNIEIGVRGSYKSKSCIIKICPNSFGENSCSPGGIGPFDVGPNFFTPLVNNNIAF